MSDRTCLACDGSGKQIDDEGWQYQCSVCHGIGKVDDASETKVMQTDDNNRLLD